MLPGPGQCAGVTPDDEPVEVHVDVASPGDDAVSLLQRSSGLSRTQLKSAMTKGAVWLSRGSRTERLRRARRKLRAGDRLHLYYNAKVLGKVPAEPTLVADVGAYSVWNKPYGMRSQGSKWGDHCTVGRWAEQHLEPQRPSFVVHRLDRAANGLLLVAHDKKTAAGLSALFRQRRVEKRYRAWVRGDGSALTSPCGVDTPLDGKPASSNIRCIRVTKDRSLFDVSIATGRKHQVRRHLAGLGFPILGDRLYGNGAGDGVDLQLTAYLLEFRCPVSGDTATYRLPVET